MRNDKQGTISLILCAVGLCLLFAGCNSVPPTSIHQPMTAKPVARVVVAPADGAIYHAGINDRPLFEDRRARNVGDILTINILESTTGSRSTTGASSSSNAIAGSTPNITTPTGPAGALVSWLKPVSINSSSSNKSAVSGSGAGSESLTGSISVTVVEVLANGNLLVSGEKRVALNNSDDFIRFSGVVNPTDISNLNVVQSTRVADAHVEFKNAGAMSEIMNDTRALGFLGRFFMSVLPF